MRPRLSPSFVVAVLALVLAAGGVGYAAGKIGSAQIKDNSVQSRDIKNGTLTSKDVKKKSIKRASSNTSCGGGRVAIFGGCVTSVVDRSVVLPGRHRRLHQVAAGAA